MVYTRSSIRFVILTMLVCIGSLVLSTGQVRAQVEACIVNIVKEALPADNTGFTFNRSDDGQFVLRDPGGTTQEITVFVGTPVTVTEQVPPGWILDDIQCSEEGLDISDVENGVTITCLTIVLEAGCTFFNVRVTTNVPTLSEWGLIAMAGILGIVGFMVIRRRKVNA